MCIHSHNYVSIDIIFRYAHTYIIIFFIAGFHDMNYVHRSHKGGMKEVKQKTKINKKLKLK